MSQNERHSSVSPYAIGTGLGLLEVISFLSAKRGLGVSTAFENSAAMLARRVAPDATHLNDYMQVVDKSPKVDWEMLLVAGVATGSYLVSSSTYNRGAGQATYSPIWFERFGGSVLKRNAAAFIGGALMMFGARMARGCTSGHGMTGNLQLAVSSLLFTSVMAVVSVAAARSIYGEEGHNE